MEKKLNIGCGKDIKKGYVNIDKFSLAGVDVVHDLNVFPWPFKDNSFEEINAEMILEHLDNWTKALEEIWRVSKNKARIKVIVPFFPSIYSVIDPTHKNFFTYFTFDYFQPNHNFSYYSKAKFNILKRHIRFSWNPVLNILSYPINWFPKFYSRYFAFMLPSNSLEFELETIK